MVYVMGYCDVFLLLFVWFWIVLIMPVFEDLENPDYELKDVKKIIWLI